MGKLTLFSALVLVSGLWLTLLMRTRDDEGVLTEGREQI